MTQLKEALAKFNSSSQPHFTEELSKTMQNVLAFYDRDFFDTYSVMLDRSKPKILREAPTTTWMTEKRDNDRQNTYRAT